jgi:manganese oxidase
MSMRSTSWLAGAALLVAALSLGFGVVALTDDDAPPPIATHGTGMGMGGAMAGHTAAAPMEGVPDATEPQGGRPLEHTVANGVWVFRLEAKPVRWEILNGTRVTAWTYNGTVPGPEIRVPYGQRVRILATNSLPEDTTVHWHGIDVPNEMDGVPDVTQKPIAPGETFTYEFDAVPAGRDTGGGTFLYHSHVDEDRQMGLGLSGAFVIEPKRDPGYDVERTIVIAEWNLDPASGATRPAMEMEGLLPNFFTLNGKSFPATETLSVRRGRRVLLRLVGGGQFTHPMHLHGTDFEVVAKDGHPLSAPFEADVIQIGSGERYDLVFAFDRPGKWVFHCHIGHHLTNNGAAPGGLLTVFDVA